MKKAPKKLIKNSKQTKQYKKHSSQFLKVYWPYIPLFVLVFFGLSFGYNWKPTINTSLGRNGVLAYATEMSTSGLLSSTNAQRAQNGGISGLTLNSKLAAAAQAKANDMVARNYWSHNTPDGKEPWTFIDAAGYVYQKAGENLAYGFDNSDATVIGWMNSPSHRANLLDTAFKEVGFGFANSSSYVGSGEETIVVAMYGNPTSYSAPVATNTTPTQTTTQKSSTPYVAPAAQPTKEDTVIAAETPVKKELKPVPSDRINQPINTDNEIPASQPTKRITRLQSITSGYAPWSAAALSGFVILVVGLWVIKHAMVVKKVLFDGEKFILHHPLFDVGVLMIVAVAILLSQSSGVIK